MCREGGEIMKKLVAVLVLLVLTLVPESCLRQPPSVEDVEAFMRKNWNDIAVVNDYLLELGEKDALISRDNGLVFIDFTHQEIKNDAVREAIQSLWREGCTYIYKDNEYHAIAYTIWTRTIDGISCGFAYAIDQTQPPELQYQTELVSLSIEGWYYYIENYEEWRQNRKTQHNTSIK